jgi:hypothetical protein
VSRERTVEPAGVEMPRYRIDDTRVRLGLSLGAGPQMTRYCIEVGCFGSGTGS